MKSKRSGQSLLEMLIALSMLTVAFLGIGTLLARSFFLNRTATDETVGAYLAAEGIEVTKSIIDHSVYGSGFTWGTEEGNLDIAPGTYTVIASSTSLSVTNIGTFLKFNPNTHLYQYQTGSPTIYKRKIVITIPPPTPPSVVSNEIDVQSIVTWSSGPLTNQTIVDSDKFYDWHP